MSKPDLTPLNLGSIARGAALELFAKALDQVTANIADTDTEPTAGREISITFKFKPESDRRTVEVTTQARTKLAGNRDHSSRAYLGKSSEQRFLIFDQDPRQDVLFEEPKAKENLLDFAANGGNPSA